MAGASPSDSSSMASSFGRPRKAIDSANICCWPPDRLAAGSSMRSPSTGNSSMMRRTCWRWVSRSRRSNQAATRRFSATVSDGNTPCPPGIWDRCSAAIRSGASLVMSLPSKCTVPALTGTVPLMALSNVDLPAPLVPSRAMISPSPMSTSTPNRTCTSP